VALGTDSFQSDLLEDMKTAALLGKIATHAIDRPNAVQTLRAATSEGAAALRRDDLGNVRVGATADLVAVDLRQPHNGPAIEPLRALVHYSNGSDVSFSMVDGHVLLRDGRFLGANPAALYTRAADAAERIWAEARARGALPMPA
jgi:cytosine/adenosine deaminase-related metal-dependent hydrolase